MNEIEENVRQELVKLVPAAVVNQISCFTFYDYHPRDNNSLDVIVCTKHCEIIEYYERQVVNSLLLKLLTIPKEIKLLRNKKCELFYLIITSNELLILTRRECIAAQKLINNVESYQIDDPLCTGQANLKVITKDDAVPLYFDENFMNLCDNVELNAKEPQESIPIITQLKRKLIEAKYIVNFNEKAYHDLLKLRHKAGYSFFHKLHSNFNGDQSTDQSKQVINTLVIKTKQPVIKVCNKQIVIALHVTNDGDLPIEDVHLLLHSSHSSLTYVTNMYVQTNFCPFWKEKHTQNLTYQEGAYILAVINLKELKNTVTSKIEFDGVVIYEKDSKSYCVPFEKVKISSLETMGENFDILYKLDENDKQMTVLSILATSSKTDLLLRHIQNDNENIQLDIIQVFCKYLNMENLLNMKNVVVHRKSTFNILYGIIIVFREWTKDAALQITVHSRSPSQVLALIHYMNDAIPYRIIATTPNYRLIAKTENLEKYNEEPVLLEQKINYTELASSLIQQTSLILKYFDECMIKMNQSKNPKVQSKIGKEIDLLALGDEKYREFRNKLIKEADKGIEAFCLNTECNIEQNDDVMIVDD